MKIPACCAAAFLFFSSAAFAQQKTTVPEISPVPSAAPSPSVAPVNSPKPVPSPTPAMKKAEGTPASLARVSADSLTEAEAQEMIGILKASYLDPAALTEAEVNRATIQGLIERLAPGASILPAAKPEDQATAPFRTEMIENRAGYIRLGALTKENAAELEKALQGFAAHAAKGVILDLRATPPSSDFSLAAEVAERFCANGEELFKITKGRTKQDHVFNSNRDPIFRGVIVVLADRETSGAPEVIAAVLRDNAKALVVGENTSGQAVEFSDMPLQSGKVLRVAVAEVVLPRHDDLFPKGVKPDIAVPMPVELKRELLRQSAEKGVTSLVTETERPRLNEAALLAGTNPEVDAIQAAQRNRAEKVKPPLRDVQLQRALDLVTTIGIYETTGK